MTADNQRPTVADQIREHQRSTVHLVELLHILDGHDGTGSRMHDYIEALPADDLPDVVATAAAFLYAAFRDMAESEGGPTVTDAIGYLDAVAQMMNPDDFQEAGQ